MNTVPQGLRYAVWALSKKPGLRRLSSSHLQLQVGMNNFRAAEMPLK